MSRIRRRAGRHIGATRQRVLHCRCIAGIGLRDRDIRIALAMLICGASRSPLSQSIGSASSIWFMSVERLRTRSTDACTFMGSSGPQSPVADQHTELATLNVTDRSVPSHCRQACLILACGVLPKVLYLWAMTHGDTTPVCYYVRGFVCTTLCAGQRSAAFLARCVY